MQIPADGTIEEDEGVFLVTLNADGRCIDFREWWNGRSRPAGHLASRSYETARVLAHDRHRRAARLDPVHLDLGRRRS